VLSSSLAEKEFPGAGTEHDLQVVLIVAVIAIAIKDHNTILDDIISLDGNASLVVRNHGNVPGHTEEELQICQIAVKSYAK
jgi:hypothetical protein